MHIAGFRKKLLHEIGEVEGILQSEISNNQAIQVHIYCIAALLRRIM